MDWQSLVALLLALAAGGWMLWSWLRPFMASQRAGCGTCGGCGQAPDASVQAPLLQIQAPTGEEGP